MPVTNCTMLSVFITCAMAEPGREEKCTGSRFSTQDALQGLRLEGKTYVMTGGNSGMGFAAATALAKANASVFMLTHSTSSGAAVQAIEHATGRRVFSIPTELTSFASVRSSVDQLKQLGIKHVDALICFAGTGINSKGSGITLDGFNSIVQVNYLSHFLLADLLMPQLRAAKGRLVIVASGFFTDKACSVPKLGQDCTKISALPQSMRTPIENATYFLSKYLENLHAAMIAQQEHARGSGVLAVSIVPGTSYSPMVAAQGISLESFRREGRCRGPADSANPFAGCTSTSAMLTNDQAAASPVYLATSPAVGLSQNGFRLRQPCTMCTSTQVISCRLDAQSVPPSVREGGSMVDYLDQLMILSRKATRHVSDKARSWEATSSELWGGAARYGRCSVMAPVVLGRPMINNNSWFMIDPTARCPSGTLATGDDFVNAAGQGRTQDVLNALKSGQDPNYLKMPGKDTALMYASVFGHFEITRALLDAKTDLNIRDEHNIDTLGHAKYGRHMPIIRMMIDEMKALKKANASAESGHKVLTQRSSSGEKVANASNTRVAKGDAKVLSVT